MAFLAWWSRPFPAPPADSIPNPRRRGLITDRFAESKVPKDLDYVVVGAGMSGLTTAGILAKMGHKVVVLEQHDRCGGGSHTYELGNGYQFDAGLHYTVPWSGPLLAMACDDKQEPVMFDRLGQDTADDTFDWVVLGGDKKFGLKHGEAHLQDMYAMFPKDHDQINKFLSVSNVLLFSTPIMILSKCFPLGTQKLIWKIFLGPFSKYAGRPALDVMREICPNKRLASLFSGLWIDTGARPDIGTFYLMAAVIRGLPREGGSYPRGGSAKMSEAVVESIERCGGRALVRADVDKIIVEDGSSKALGVVLKDGSEILAKRGVISSAGYMNTFDKMLPEGVAEKFGYPNPCPIPHSHGYVMVNIGYKGCGKDYDVTNTNIWYADPARVSAHCNFIH